LRGHQFSRGLTGSLEELEVFERVMVRQMAELEAGGGE
jgi:hypothetical protein